MFRYQTMGYYWLINKADVVTMYIPFPNTLSTLALKKHMYICIQAGNDKEFVKCQSFKPIHMSGNHPPFHYIIEEEDVNRNPFYRCTIIDCDKSFCVSCVVIKKEILERRNVCDKLFDSIIEEIRHDDFVEETLNQKEISFLNYFIYPSN